MIVGKTSENLLGQLLIAINRFINGKQCIGYETIITNSPGVTYVLNVPKNANEALITLEVSSIFNDLTTVRYYYNIDGGTLGPFLNGIGMYSSDSFYNVYDTNGLIIKGNTNLKNFKLRPLVGVSSSLKVTYFN